MLFYFFRPILISNQIDMDIFSQGVDNPPWSSLSEKTQGVVGDDVRKALEWELRHKDRMLAWFFHGLDDYVVHPRYITSSYDTSSHKIPHSSNLSRRGSLLSFSHQQYYQIAGGIYRTSLSFSLRMRRYSEKWDFQLLLQKSWKIEWNSWDSMDNQVL